MAHMYRYGITGLTSIEQTEWRSNTSSRPSREYNERPLPPLPDTAVGFSSTTRRHKKPNATSAAYHLSLLTLAPDSFSSSLPPPSARPPKKRSEAWLSSPNASSHGKTASHQPQQRLETAVPWQQEQRYQNNNNSNDDERDRNNAPTVTKFTRFSGSTANYDNAQTTLQYAIAPTPVGHKTTEVYFHRAVYDDDHVQSSGVHHAQQQQKLHFIRQNRDAHNKLTTDIGSNISTCATTGGHHYRFVQVGNDHHHHHHSDSIISATESLSTPEADNDCNNITFSGTTTDNEKLYELGQRQQQLDSSSSSYEIDEQQQRMQQDFLNDSSGVSNKFSGHETARELQNNGETNNQLLFPTTKIATTTVSVNGQSPPTPPPLPASKSPFKLLHAHAQTTLPANSKSTTLQQQQRAVEALNTHNKYEEQCMKNVISSNLYDDAGVARLAEHQNDTNCSASSSSSSVFTHGGVPHRHQQQVVVSTDLDALTDDCFNNHYQQSNPSLPREEITADHSTDKIAVTIRECARNNSNYSSTPPRPPTLPAKTAKVLALQQVHKSEAIKSSFVADSLPNTNHHQTQPAEEPFQETPPQVVRPKPQQKPENFHQRRRMTTTIDVEQLFRLAQQQASLVDKPKAFMNCEGAVSAANLSSAASTTSTLTAQCALPDNSEVYQIAGGSKMPDTTTRMNHFESTQSSIVAGGDEKQPGRVANYWRRSELYPLNGQQTTYAQSSISAQLLQDASSNSINNGAAADAVFVAATNAVMMATRAGGATVVGQQRFHSTNSARGYADTTNLPTVRRLVQLVEMHQYHEGVKLIAQMQQGHFSAIVLELPLDTWIAHYPKSLPLLDAVYARVASLDHTDQLVPDLRRRLHIQPLLFHIVKFYATHLHAKYPSVKQREPIRLYDMHAVDIDTRSLLRSLYKIDSRLTSFLKRKKKALEDALQSLGEHGLIHCIQEGEDLFYSLSDALRKELDRIITAAKVAVETADSVEPAMKPMKPATLTKKSLAKRVANRESLMQKRHGSSSKRSGSGPSEQSHQHMLQLKYDEIQTRVKRNTRLLQTLQPIKQVQDMLNLLMSTLQRRINNDEVVLSQMSELKKGYQFDPHTNVADTLKMFIAGCDSVLYMLQTLNGNVHDKVDTGSLVISMTNNQESDQLSGTTSIASSANQLQRMQSSSLRKNVNVRMFGDSRASSYTGADFQTTYLHNQSPSPPKTSSSGTAQSVLVQAITATDTSRKQVAVATRPQHLLYASAASSSSSASPTPDKTSNVHSPDNNQIFDKKHQPTSGVSSSSGVSGGGSTAGSSSHSPVMTMPVQSSASPHNVDVQTSFSSTSASSSTLVGVSAKSGGSIQTGRNGGDGTPSEVSGYQSGHSSPVTRSVDTLTQGTTDVATSKDHDKLSVSKQESGSQNNNNNDALQETETSKPLNFQQQTKADPYSYNPFHQKSSSSASTAGITINGFAPPGNDDSTSTSTKTSRHNKVERADFADHDEGHLHSRNEDFSVAVDDHHEVQEQYERLYHYARDDVKQKLDLNDISSTTDENEELKDKLVFSVMVLAFRSVESSISQARRAASADSVPLSPNFAPNGETASPPDKLHERLVRRLETHDLQINIEEIKTHLHLTLYDFPHLLSSAELANFIARCVKTVWSICVRAEYTPTQTKSSNPFARSSASYHIDYDKSVFDGELHCRAPGSDEASNLIRNYMWPSLVVTSIDSNGDTDKNEGSPDDKQTIQCIFKGIVLT